MIQDTDQGTISGVSSWMVEWGLWSFCGWWGLFGIWSLLRRHVGLLFESTSNLERNPVNIDQRWYDLLYDKYRISKTWYIAKPWVQQPIFFHRRGIIYSIYWYDILGSCVSSNKRAVCWAAGTDNLGSRRRTEIYNSNWYQHRPGFIRICIQCGV